MEKIPSIPEEIIIRNILNEATDSEKRQLNEWFLQDKKHVELYYQMEEVWSSRNVLDQNVLQEEWDRLYEDIEGIHQSRSYLPSQTQNKHSRILWMRYAAAIFIGVLITSAVWFGLRNTVPVEQKLFIQNVVYNHEGVQQLVLPDSSKVFINENSKLTYPEEFQGGKRLVLLEGKAFFDVHKDKVLPFIVRAGNVDIEVTGTTFFVDAIAGNKASIVLMSGGVNVNCSDNNGQKSFARLIPGQEAIVDIVTGGIQVANVDTEYYALWKDGTYRFTDEPLNRIINFVSRRLDLDIQISPSLKARRFTGRIASDDDIRSILAVISKSYPIKYQITDKKVKIYE